jgi:carboxylesterase type B
VNVTNTNKTDDAQASAAAAIAAVEQTVRQLTDQADDRVSARPSSIDVLTALAELRGMQDQLAAWEPLLIGAARDRGVSWAAIAPALGVASRQAAERRYLRLNPHTTDQEGMTGEQRVQAARDRRAGERAVTQWARTNAATLRRLAAQITALDDLDPAAQDSVDQVLHALGDSDTATLLTPLADAGAKLEDSHPALAGQVADVTATTDHLRNEQITRTP